MQKVTHFALAAGQHNEISARLIDWVVEPFQDGPLVELRALADTDLGGRLFSEKHPLATTLAFHMDPKVAIGLAERILALARSMGLELPPTIEYRA